MKGRPLSPNPYLPRTSMNVYADDLTSQQNSRLPYHTIHHAFNGPSSASPSLLNSSSTSQIIIQTRIPISTYDSQLALHSHLPGHTMASTDSTIPDTTTGDSTGGQGGESFTDKAKTALTGNIPVSRWRAKYFS